MEKPLSHAKGEVEKCAMVYEYYATHATQFLADEPVDIANTTSFISYQPLGTILAVMPWNCPLWQVFRFLAPALIAGNTDLLKHLSNMVGSALVIKNVVLETSAVFKKSVLELGGSDPYVVLIDADIELAAQTCTASRLINGD